MTNLLWPGDERAGELMSDQAMLAALAAVETAWLDALVVAGVAPTDCAGVDLADLVNPHDEQLLADDAERGGNPVVVLVEALRQRAEPAVGQWIHRGLTSQDVLDTALIFGLRAVLDRLLVELGGQLSTLSALTDAHRHTPMVARTLTQHAVPTTFGAKAAGWLGGVADAYQRLAALSTPVQIGGAAGTLAAPTELVALTSQPPLADPAAAALALTQIAAATLGLEPALPWHTRRSPVTMIGDALVTCTDAWGSIASDVVTLARPEIGELSEPPGLGRSSTMPDKRNPVLSILLRRAAITAPPLAATLHTAAALANDERPDGAWHAEWDTLRILARRSVVAGSQCSELLAGLQVNTNRMARNFADANIGGEQAAIGELARKPVSPTYFGAIDLMIDQTLARVERFL